RAAVCCVPVSILLLLPLPCPPPSPYTTLFRSHSPAEQYVVDALLGGRKYRFFRDDVCHGLLERCCDICGRNFHVTNFKLFYGTGYRSFEAGEGPVVAVFLWCGRGAHVFWGAQAAWECEGLWVAFAGHLVDDGASRVAGADQSGDFVIGFACCVVDGATE